ncbi:MAG: NAD(P)-dependent oxidoreductase [Planctomycetota bacterium]
MFNDGLIDEARLDDQLSRPQVATIETLGKYSGPVSVLGAGGKMGFHVLRMLQRCFEAVDRRDAITAVSRFTDSRQRELIRHHGFDLHACDLSDPEEYRQLPEAAQVFFLAGIKFGTRDKPELLQRMNVTLPRLVAEHYRAAEIVALSTGCVYGFTEPETGGSNEDSPTDPPGDYALSCLGREQAFAEGAVQHGTRVCLVRLNYAVEPRYGVLVDLASKIASGQPIDLRTGYVNLIGQADAVNYVLRALSLAETPARVLNVTGKAVLRVRDLAEALAERLDCSVQFVGKERSTAWLNNATLSHRLFGEPPTPLSSILDDVVAWQKGGGRLLHKPTQFEVRDGAY